MNVQNINTATSGSPDAWEEGQCITIPGLSPALAGSLQLLASVCMQDMDEKCRTKRLYGALLMMAWQVCDTVARQPRPQVPAASQIAWEQAGQLVCSGFCEAGEILWKLACQELESGLRGRVAETRLQRRQ
ncbi:hypothetical protein ACQFN5_00260 (plasmid) [Klebsiella sp. WOUb02]|uniref:hypothetical protein n=1 Tax=Klebsiella sp. WOUb02 TaxID=3161071 RepID=UPI003CF3C36C